MNVTGGVCGEFVEFSSVEYREIYEVRELGYTIVTY